MWQTNSTQQHWSWCAWNILSACIDCFLFRPPHYSAKGEIQFSCQDCLVRTMHSAISNGNLYQRCKYPQNGGIVRELLTFSPQCEHWSAPVETEVSSWNKSDLPSNPLEASNNCDERVSSNLATLPKIMCTIPVTSCEAKRSFPALRRLKTY